MFGKKLTISKQKLTLLSLHFLMGQKEFEDYERWFEYHVNGYIIYKLLKLVGKLFGFYNFGDCWVDYCHVRINVVRCICCPPQCGWKMHVLPWMNGFRLQNPKPHTALDDILPCGDNATAQEAALRTTLYGQVEAAANVSYVLYCYDKFSTNLQTCRFVMVAFRDISSGECHGLEKHSSWICNWVGNLSAALEVFWVIYGRERKQCLYIKNCFLKRAIGNSKTRRVVI